MLVLLQFCVCPDSPAQVTYTVTSVADSFLAAGAPGNPAGTNLTDLNYGAAGILVVAPAASVKGEFQSIVKFDLSGASNLFNAAYGTNNWLVGGISLQLNSNYGAAGQTPDNALFPVISGGQFLIEWLAENNWVEGTGIPKAPTMDGVTYDSLPGLLAGAHDILCTNTYAPPGDNVPVTYPLPLDTNLIAAVAQGGEVTLLFQAADDQIAYLFNSRNFGGTNQPCMNVTAGPPPPQILSGTIANGKFHLTGLGAANMQYQILCTANLAATNWQNLGTATADSQGNIQFDDPNATNYSRRFYRLSN